MICDSGSGLRNPRCNPQTLLIKLASLREQTQPCHCKKGASHPNQNHRRRNLSADFFVTSGAWSLNAPNGPSEIPRGQSVVPDAPPAAAILPEGFYMLQRRDGHLRLGQPRRFGFDTGVTAGCVGNAEKAEAILPALRGQPVIKTGVVASGRRTI